MARKAAKAAAPAEATDQRPARSTGFVRFIPAYVDRVRNSVHTPHPFRDGVWHEWAVTWQHPALGNNAWAEPI